jgi:hypothetical protein
MLEKLEQWLNNIPFVDFRAIALINRISQFLFGTIITRNALRGSYDILDFFG